MNRARGIVPLVAIRTVEDALLAHEHLMPERKVRCKVALGSRHPEFGLEHPRLAHARSSGPRPIVSGTAPMGASSDFRPEHAWHRAQPAFAELESIPRKVMYVWTRR